MDKFTASVLALITVFLLIFSVIHSISVKDTAKSIQLISNRMDKLDSVINNIFGVNSTQEIRDAVRDMRAEHTHLDKKQTVIIIKLEKILEIILKGR